MRHFVWTVILTLAACAAFQGYPPQAATLEVTWTAPGDDGDVGTASLYDIRFSLDSVALITWGTRDGQPGYIPEGTTTLDSVVFSDRAVKLPDTAGTSELHLLLGMTAGQTWYIAIRARDEAHNWSDMSNIVRIFIPEDVRPAAIVDVQVRIVP